MRPNQHLLCCQNKSSFSEKMLSEATNHNSKKNETKIENSRRWVSGNIFICTEILIGRINAHCRFCAWVTLVTGFQ